MSIINKLLKPITESDFFASYGSSALATDNIDTALSDDEYDFSIVIEDTEVSDSVATDTDITEFSDDVAIDDNITDISCDVAIDADISDISGDVANDADITDISSDVAIDADITEVSDEVNADNNTDNNINVRTYFNENGFEITLSEEPPCIPGVENLAFMLALNYKSCKLLLKHIRDSITKKCFRINYTLNHLSRNEREAIVGVCEKLSNCGILSNLFYGHKLSSVNGNISSAPRIINFLNGNYLEYYARAVAVKVVKEISEKYNTDYEIYSNVIIKKGNEKHELDLVFRISDKIFWSEIKSGAFSDFDAYRKLGVSIGVNPDRHILLAAEKDDESADIISWFYRFYVSNIENFKNKTEEMITKAFETSTLDTGAFKGGNLQ